MGFKLLAVLKGERCEKNSKVLGIMIEEYRKKSILGLYYKGGIKKKEQKYWEEASNFVFSV